jgi:hypothetical protein
MNILEQWRLGLAACACAGIGLAAAAPAPGGAAGGAQAELPTRRAHHALEYDQGSQRVLLTGGSTPVDGGARFVFMNDLWAFEGTRWTLLPVTGARMSGMRLAYDNRHQRMLSFGGYDGASRGELRGLGAGGWEALGRHPEVVAAEPGFVYDGRANRLVLFGGSAGPGQANGDTWILTGGSWRKLAGQGPSARQAQVMVYDEQRDRTVLFGGMGSGPPGQPPPSLGDTWELEGERWIRRELTGPSARSGAGATYDSKRGLLILFGGVGAEGFLGDTWAYDGSAWRKLADTGPEPRGMGYLAYDRRRDRVVLFGGRKGWPNGDLNDTWEWDGAAWREVSPKP